MIENREKLILLERELDRLSTKQSQLAHEIDDLRKSLKIAEREVAQEESTPRLSFVVEEPDEEPIASSAPPVTFASGIPSDGVQASTHITEPDFSDDEMTDSQFKHSQNLERLIGENIISKIGIAILILGVGIGTKYAIDHDLISPLTRIILGYMTGLGLFGVAARLKSKYEQYSAVLLSGAMAVMYFVTYAAYSYYSLIPQSVTFGLMALMTVFTVLASLSYNRQIIALYGLVGAYAVPFLLSDGSGRVGVLFSYMAIVNVGILALAYQKYWKLLNYVSFALTWLIYCSWSMESFDAQKHFSLAFVFLLLFFITFYLTFLLYKVHKKEIFGLTDVVMILLNSFVFYALGYSLFDQYVEGSQLLGLFTLCNGLVHAGVSWMVYKQKLADKNLYYLLTGMVLVFAIIAVPVQLDGNWVTLLWMALSVVLIIIGRRRQVKVYEGLSYALLLLATISLLDDWTKADPYTVVEGVVSVYPLLNIAFVSSAMMTVAYGYWIKVNLDKRYPTVLLSERTEATFLHVLSTVFIVSLYVTCLLEIFKLFDYTDTLSAIRVKGDVWVHNHGLRAQKALWVINYSLAFVSGLLYINFKKIQSHLISIFGSAIGLLLIVIFLSAGMMILNSINGYYDQHYFQPSAFTYMLRYVSYLFIGGLYYTVRLSIRQTHESSTVRRAFLLVSHVVLLWILSAELIHWLNEAGQKDSYKLGISILWGVYSLAVVVLGIRKKNKALRIGAISLFSITLLKLFLYDLAHLTTIAKTIVLVSLGVLLLIISFLYSKYKHLITDDEDEQAA